MKWTCFHIHPFQTFSFNRRRKKFNIRWLESELNTKESFPAQEREEKTLWGFFRNRTTSEANFEILFWHLGKKYSLPHQRISFARSSIFFSWQKLEKSLKGTFLQPGKCNTHEPIFMALSFYGSTFIGAGPDSSSPALVSSMSSKLNISYKYENWIGILDSLGKCGSSRN